MAPQPIKATGHGLVDYGLTAVNTLGPQLLGLNARAKLVFGALGATQGAVNALTDTPVGVRPLLSLRTHGVLDLTALPAFVALPLLAGAVTDARSRALWLGGAAALATVYVFTDWTAPPRS
jgi:hypothetical protein